MDTSLPGQVATRGSILYFVIADLANINPMSPTMFAMTQRHAKRAHSFTQLHAASRSQRQQTKTHIKQTTIFKTWCAVLTSLLIATIVTQRFFPMAGTSSACSTSCGFSRHAWTKRPRVRHLRLSYGELAQSYLGFPTKKPLAHEKNTSQQHMGMSENGVYPQL